MDQLIQPAWLEANLDAPDLRILDCSVVFERIDGDLTVESAAGRWAQGHIPGSAHVDLVFDLADRTSEHRFMMPSPEQVAGVMEARGVGEGTRVVLYDDEKNMWAARVWWMLRALGFDAAGVLDGGLARWKSEGRRLTTEPAPDRPHATFPIRLRPGLFADKHEVLAAIEDDRTILVNALSEAHFNGENEDYGRPGHIPTSINVPAASLVDEETHAYAGLDELRRRFAPVLEAGKGRAITYCGGGISAASNAFVLSLLGADDVAIYDASMSEWGADPSLPITVPTRD